MRIPVLVSSILASTVLAAQNWVQIPTPVDDQVFDHKIEVDNTNDQIALLPTWINWDSVYTKSGNDPWVGRMQGEFPDGFYTDNGTFFLLEDTDPNANLLVPVVHKSLDNGATFTQVPNVSGRCFHQDQDGNIFFSTNDGFMYSTDQGDTFMDVNTPEPVLSAAMDVNGDLYFASYFREVYHSTDGGANWADVSKGTSTNALIKDLQVQNGVLYFDDGDGSYLFGALADVNWSIVQPGVVLTSWVSGMRIHPDGYFIQSPYGLYTTPVWAATNWNLILAGFGGNPTPFGYFVGGYTLSSDHIYARVDSGYVKTTISSVVSVNDLPADHPVASVYPNPVRDMLYVRFARPAQDVNVDIFDVSGRKVWTRHYPATGPLLNIPFPPLGTGIFFLELRDQHKTYRVERIVRSSH